LNEHETHADSISLIEHSAVAPLLAASAARHNHLCPRQVLGVRVGLAGLGYLGLPPNSGAKRVLVFSETDGCFLDGLEVATGATPGHRTLRVEDFGKAGATLVDTETGRAVRVAPRVDSRSQARQYAALAPRVGSETETRDWYIMLHAYQGMPEEALLTLQPVRLTTPVEVIISQPGLRAACTACGEEIINEREVQRQGQVYCRACAGSAYYVSLKE
jgi:formylmethanofuran dehydrogenase subunit E